MSYDPGVSAPSMELAPDGLTVIPTQAEWNRMLDSALKARDRALMDFCRWELEQRTWHMHGCPEDHARAARLKLSLTDPPQKYRRTVTGTPERRRRNPSTPND